MSKFMQAVARCASVHDAMRQQAGGRMIVSFVIPDGDGGHNRMTSHYGTVEEVWKEWDRLVERHGKGVCIESAHSDTIIAHRYPDKV